ncbi:auxin-responsive protein IAA4-like [Zingiber officinale]|uniref:Auxin-responsive protein n=1 Tax=Zingiber officinale TaxID=94328 RepID=A0A8J5CYF8_ZINOF|nr:auxin-responsive protein IAA4-like [Zingiber officinale]KAG6474821.1 hypothetical protein ZIOFF_064036 [Zingiber officinale]
MGGYCNSPSSSIDSSCDPDLSTSSIFEQRRDLSTELRLGLSLSSSSLQHNSHKEKDPLSDWPPIKPLLRSTLEGKAHQSNSETFFVKVYMEGVPIGRKLDLFAHDGYDDLIKSLRRMFRTTITCSHVSQVPLEKSHVLTYEDEEGDWMMVGDVPWELFLSTVKKLKITRVDKC